MNYKQSIYLHILTIILVLIGSIETVSTNIMGFSILNLINNNSIKIGFIFVIAISCLYHLFNKYTYLPFLNYNVLPHSLLKTESNIKLDEENLVAVDIDIPNDNKYSHVIYWASSENNKDINNTSIWYLAYGEFPNSGIQSINTTNTVNIKIRCPSQYKVPSLFGEKIIPKHVHYRFISKDGMMSRIYTKYITC